MGEAYDQGGNVIARAFGQTKQEVMGKLAEAAPNAEEVRIRTLRDMDEQPCDMAPQQGMMMRARDRVISVPRRRELLSLAAEASDWIINKNIKPHELCFFKNAVGMLTDTRE